MAFWEKRLNAKVAKKYEEHEEIFLFHILHCLRIFAVQNIFYVRKDAKYFFILLEGKE
jgi:hypothetical protein